MKPRLTVFVTYDMNTNGPYAWNPHDTEYVIGPESHRGEAILNTGLHTFGYTIKSFVSYHYGHMVAMLGWSY